MKKKTAIMALVGGLALLLVVGVGEKRPLAIWTTPSGTEYRVLAISQGHLSFVSGRVLTIKFLSRDLKDPSVLDTEFLDMFEMVPTKIPLDGIGHVALKAVDKPGKVIGISFKSTRSRLLSVQQVKELSAGVRPTRKRR